MSCAPAGTEDPRPDETKTPAEPRADISEDWKKVGTLTLQIGKHWVGRLDNGQLYVYDGVRGTFPDETKVEGMLTAILENRWKV